MRSSAVSSSLPRRKLRWRLLALRLGAVAVVLALVGSTAIWTDALGAGDRWQRVLDKVDRFLAGPVPDRPTVPTIVVEESSPPLASLATAGPSASEVPSPTPLATFDPATLGPPPAVREPLDLRITADPAAYFDHELTKTWCAPAGIQMVLALHGRGDTSAAFQRQIAGRVHEFESYADAHDGGWGPASMSEALAAYGVPGYEVRAYATREQALRDSAIALEATDAPVILLAWYGAHTWVMTGFRADADPRIYADAVVAGTYILDPWYPTISSLWGASDPPGTFQDSAEMVRNFLPWKRPEGTYPDKDGRFIVVVPTLPLPVQS